MLASPMPRSSVACPEGSNPRSRKQAFFRCNFTVSTCQAPSGSVVGAVHLLTHARVTWGVVCLSGRSTYTVQQCSFSPDKRSLGGDQGSPASQDFPFTSCLQRRLAQYCSRHQGGHELGVVVGPPHVDPHAGTHSGRRVRKLNRVVRSDSGL